VNKETEVLRLNGRRDNAQLLIQFPAAPREIAHDRRELDGYRLGWRRNFVRPLVATQTEKKRCIQPETGGLA
jgi:hypothetical protein